MIHHRRVAGGGHPHQSTPTGASNGNSGFAGRSHATTGSDHGMGVAAAALVDGLVGDSTPPGAGALHSGARREPPWGSKDHLRRKVAIVAAIGTESLESLRSLRDNSISLHSLALQARQIHRHHPYYNMCCFD